MGQDSWQAEQRSPYFRAKAGKAFAGWLLLRTMDARTRATAAKEVASCKMLRRWKRLEACMAGLLGKIKSNLVILKSTSSQHTRRYPAMRASKGRWLPIQTGSRTVDERFYYPTEAASYYRR